ncbi:hypothetical protein KC318_g14417 [Hortaea werneckii]|nr:hypothetical protein KC334_g11373 [Hortaea werneckii]KAI6950586.1 hypothetical protein KC355_g14359 [Hortaea werneckii]KAI7653190.1 hypothetical protein KC318_g14417 [Hortaea werneckii]
MSNQPVRRSARAPKPKRKFGELKEVEAPLQNKRKAPKAAGRPSGNDQPAPQSAETQGAKQAQLIPPDFKGTTDEQGSSSNKPIGGPRATLDKPWHCANRMCNTGMTWFQRDGTAQQAVGRKSISQFFGRNKKATGLIDNDVFHTYCRKCYQRRYYQYSHQTEDGADFKNKPEQGVACFHMLNLRAQFIRLQLWRPDATFSVQFNNAMTDRHNDYQAFLRQHNQVTAAARNDYDLKYPLRQSRSTKKAPKSRRDAGDVDATLPKPEESFPVDLYDTFLINCCGSDYSYDRITQVLDYIQNWLDAGTIRSIPPVEFLISGEQPTETINSHEDNYMLWLETVDNRRYVNRGDGHDANNNSAKQAHQDAANAVAGPSRPALPSGNDASRSANDPNNDQDDDAVSPPPFKLSQLTPAQQFEIARQNADFIGIKLPPGDGKLLYISDGVQAAKAKSNAEIAADNDGDSVGGVVESIEPKEEDGAPPVTGKKPII